MQRTETSFVRTGELEHPYPPTKIMWSPDKSQNSTDLLATTGGCLVRPVVVAVAIVVGVGVVNSPVDSPVVVADVAVLLLLLLLLRRRRLLLAAVTVFAAVGLSKFGFLLLPLLRLLFPPAVGMSGSGLGAPSCCSRWLILLLWLMMAYISTSYVHTNPSVFSPFVVFSTATRTLLETARTDPRGLPAIVERGRAGAGRRETALSAQQRE